MAKTTSGKAQVPTGFKVSETNDRKGQRMFLAFVDKEQGVFGSRKGAVARDRTMNGLIDKLNSRDVLEGLTGVSRSPTPKAAKTTAPAKGASKRQAAADADSELEAID